MVFTIHNLDFGQTFIGEAAYYCQRFTTVSPTYAIEVRTIYTSLSPISCIHTPAIPANAHSILHVTLKLVEGGVFISMYYTWIISERTYTGYGGT